jgi:hypothetical protein
VGALESEGRFFVCQVVRGFRKVVGGWGESISFQATLFEFIMSSGGLL